MLFNYNYINVIKNLIFTLISLFIQTIAQFFIVSRNIFSKLYNEFSKATIYELTLYFGLTLVLFVLSSIDDSHTYIYIFILLCTLMIKELLVPSVVVFSLLLPFVVTDDYYDKVGDVFLASNFLALLYQPIFFIVFIFLCKGQTVKKLLEEMEMSYTELLKVSLLVFIVNYAFTFSLLCASFAIDINYYLEVTSINRIGDQECLITFITPFFNFPFSLTFYIDELSILFMGLGLLLISLCILFLWPTLELDVNRNLYVSQLVLLLTQLQATFTASDLLTFFVAFESLLIPMMIMIAIWGSKNNRQANNYLVFYTMFSAIPMLLAILYINYTAGTLNISVLHELMVNKYISWTWKEEM